MGPNGRRALTGAAAAALIGAPAPAFRIFRPNPAGQAAPPGAQSFYMAEGVPTDFPPFVHWDMREMPKANPGMMCRVPWCFDHTNIPDLDGNGTAGQAADIAAARAAFTASYTTWENVTPAIIAFREEPAAGPPAGVTGLAMDGYNVLSFNGRPSDDQQCVAVGAMPAHPPIPPNPAPAELRPYSPVVSPGANGVLETQVRAGDQLIACIIDGGNGMSETHAAIGGGNDDVQVVPGPPPGGLPPSPVGGCNVLVTAGPDGVLQTAPGGDDRVSTCIVAGANLTCDSDGNNLGMVVGGLPFGLTAIFFNNSSGVILESDVQFPQSPTFPAQAGPPPMPAIPGMWRAGGAHNAAPAVNVVDLQTEATHEIGHTLGFAHPPGGGTQQVGNPIMNPFYEVLGILPGPPQAVQYQNNNHTLHPDDEDACNWVYTPDMGDAPDPCTLDPEMMPFPAPTEPNHYQTIVREVATGRMLNGIPLDRPIRGPEHLFGWRRGAVAGPPAAPAMNFQFEWLGGDMNNSPMECDPLMVDMDMFDDGVTVTPHPMSRAQAVDARVVITYREPLPGEAHVYGPCGSPNQLLYYDGYFDFNNNCRFEEAGADMPIAWSGYCDRATGMLVTCPLHTKGFVDGTCAPGAPGQYGSITLNFRFTCPIFAPNKFWCRHRLDYGEDEGRRQRFDPTLAPAEGAAQFGEVEDYPCRATGSYDPPLQLHGAEVFVFATLGTERTLSARLMRHFQPVPNHEVKFANVIPSAEIEFTSGVLSDAGRAASVWTGEDGWATVTFIPRSAGQHLMRVSAPPSQLAGYHAFQAIASAMQPGDVNGDCVVNFLDLNAVLSTYGQTGSLLAGDVDRDGDVDFADLNLVLDGFGSVCDPLP